MADDADARDAQITLRRLEERGDNHTLRVLGALYADLAERAYSDAVVVDAAGRLREAARARDAVYRRANPGDLADEFRARGVQVYEPDLEPHPVDLRRAGAAFRRLAREALEAAEGIGV
jgi:hypothetical protein